MKRIVEGVPPTTSDLVSKIKLELSAAKNSGLSSLERYRNAGRIFHRLKRRKKGTFDVFCRKHFDVSHEWRRQMMHLAEHWDDCVRQREALVKAGKLDPRHDTLRGAVALIESGKDDDIAKKDRPRPKLLTQRAYEELEVISFELALSPHDKVRVKSACRAFQKAKGERPRRIAVREISRVAQARRHRVRRLLDGVACCRFRGHRDWVFHEAGGLPCKDGSSVASSRLKRLDWSANGV